MNEIISSILSAESKADELIKDSREKAKSVVLDAETRAEEIKKRSVSVFKMHRKAELKKAENEAEELYEEKLILGKNEAEKLKNSVENKIDSAAEDVVKDILGR